MELSLQMPASQLFVSHTDSCGRPGYSDPHPRLWKVKHVPTIDFLVQRAPAGLNAFELMLRGAPGCVQSVHRFRNTRDGFEYRMPVLLVPPAGVDLVDGDVVELGVSVVRDYAHRTANVHFPTMHVREAGKLANCLVGGMDLTANGMTLDTFLQPDCPLLPRLLMSGPMRAQRVRFLSSIVRPHILEVGGGRGGDLGVWARHPVVRCVDVVDPDPEALREYMRRLRTSYDARADGDCFVLPDGRRFRFHVVAAPDIPGHIGAGADIAILCFSASQIITDGSSADMLWRVLLERVPRVAVAAHDHLVAGLPDPLQPYGVTCRIVRPSGCPTHPVVCRCPDGMGQSARLHTRIRGSTMADGIVENAFSVAAHILDPAKRMGLRVFVQRACTGGDTLHHWLLRSLVFATLDRPV